MYPIKVMPCLDMKNGRVVKGVHFADIRDAGDPVEKAAFYQKEGADELAMLDIAATVENRRTRIEWVRQVSAVILIPLTVGGGINSLEDIELVLGAGAGKVSLNRAAVKRPELVREAAKKYGSDRITVAIDARRNKAMPSGSELVVAGGTTPVGEVAIAWAKRCQELGAGVILPTSMDGDGTLAGYDLEPSPMWSLSPLWPREKQGSGSTSTRPLSRAGPASSWQHRSSTSGPSVFTR